MPNDFSILHRVTWVTVWKHSIKVKIGDFCPVWTWHLMNDLEKQLGTSSVQCQALCIISKPSVNSNWTYSPETPNLGKKQFWGRVTLKFEGWLWTFNHHHHMWIHTGVMVQKWLNWVLTSMALTFCMNITSAIGNNSWKLHNDTMTGTLWKRCNRRTDRWTDRRRDRSVLRAAWSHLKSKKLTTQKSDTLYCSLIYILSMKAPPFSGI